VKPVTIAIEVEPTGVDAKVMVAGQTVSGGSIRLTEHHGFASVSVTAPGYFPYRKLVQLEGDETTVKVKLKPMPSQRRKPMPIVLLVMVVIAIVKLALSCN
jgi:hypothetical protein